ncbi:MAG: class I SAM-dependent methyltransferase [Bacteroidota bacterium]
MRTIQNKQITDTLARMHKEASSQGFEIIKGLSKGIFRKLRPEDMEDAYLPISRRQGEFLYDILVERDIKHMVEFGTSFGISTLYLGAAAKQTGGKVITTELLASKCRIAEQNFQEAGLEDVIDVREGDALQTLSRDLPDEIEFLLLDGWNDLYLPLLEQLEPKLKRGCLIYTDNVNFQSTRPFMSYLKGHPEIYQRAPIQDGEGGAELTVFLGQPVLQ